jgi:hypothetical protein
MAPPKKTRYVATFIITVEPGSKSTSRVVRENLSVKSDADDTSVELKSFKPLETEAKTAPAAKAKPKAKAKAATKGKAKKKDLASSYIGELGWFGLRARPAFYFGRRHRWKSQVL